MQDARNGPRMDEDPVGPRHGVAGGPVGYKHGMRGEGMGTGPGAGCGKGERDIAGCRMQRDRGNRTAGTKQQTRGLGNQPPWSAELWTNHGEPGHRKFGKMP